MAFFWRCRDGEPWTGIPGSAWGHRKGLMAGGRGMALQLVTLWKAWADLRVRPAEEGKRAALTCWTSSKDICWIWRHRCFSSGISFVVVCPFVLGNCWLVMVTALHVTILWGNLEGSLLRKVLWIVAFHSLGNYWKPDSFLLKTRFLPQQCSNPISDDWQLSVPIDCIPQNGGWGVEFFPICWDLTS